MRNLLLLGTVLMMSGCAQQHSLTATWAYGTGVGDGAPYAGPKPTYGRESVGSNDENVSVGPATTER